MIVYQIRYRRSCSMNIFLSFDASCSSCWLGRLFLKLFATEDMRRSSHRFANRWWLTEYLVIHVTRQWTSLERVTDWFLLFCIIYFCLKSLLWLKCIFSTTERTEVEWIWIFNDFFNWHLSYLNLFKGDIRKLVLDYVNRTTFVVFRQENCSILFFVHTLMSSLYLFSERQSILIAFNFVVVSLIVNLYKSQPGRGQLTGRGAAISEVILSLIVWAISQFFKVFTSQTFKFIFCQLLCDSLEVNFLLLGKTLFFATPLGFCFAIDILIEMKSLSTILYLLLDAVIVSSVHDLEAMESIFLPLCAVSIEINQNVDFFTVPLVWLAHHETHHRLLVHAWERNRLMPLCEELKHLATVETYRLLVSAHCFIKRVVIRMVRNISDFCHIILHNFS